jgi:hypothetical protein
MKKPLSGLVLATLSLVLSACQTAGTGTGNVRGTRKPVAFTWESTDSVSGNITATFGTGKVFKGTYFRITWVPSGTAGAARTPAAAGATGIARKNASSSRNTAGACSPTCARRKVTKCAAASR